jgi:hypothetical protein
VACDEPGDAQHALITDGEDPTHDNARKNGLWGNIMAGGAGVEWYFGYKHPHSDLTCQDYRSRDLMWDQCRYALQFFDRYEIPFWEMTCDDALAGREDAYCLYKRGEVYLVYRKTGGKTTVDLSGVEGKYAVKWYDPRSGGDLQAGSVAAVSGGGVRDLGNPPDNAGRDWLAMVRLAD